MGMESWVEISLCYLFSVWVISLLVVPVVIGLSLDWLLNSPAAPRACIPYSFIFAVSFLVFEAPLL